MTKQDKKPGWISTLKIETLKNKEKDKQDGRD